MKKIIRMSNSAVSDHKEVIRDRLLFAAYNNGSALFQNLGTEEKGMPDDKVDEAREAYGANVVSHGKKELMIKRVGSAFINPFTAILFVLALVSCFTDIVLVNPGERNYVTVAIIAAMVLISGFLRFVQETRSGNAAARLLNMIHTTTCVERLISGRQEILLEEVVVGDMVILSAGDMIPADVRILSAKDLFISQSALTGESEPVEKLPDCICPEGDLAAVTNLAYMGTNVISGSARAVVVAVGDDTMFGTMARELTQKPAKTSFEKGVNSISWVLIRFMLIMVPIVLLVNGFTKGDWLDASLFALSIAVGLTPEMLPMIVTTSLAKGAVAMSKKKVIIKNLNSIQNLGSIDLLCTDKTGTLTQDKVILEYHLDIHGNEDEKVLRYGFLNSYYQTGLKNLIDIAIISKYQELSEPHLERTYLKADEIPFDFNRRRMSVVVADQEGRTQMITKGAVEEMLNCCTFVEDGGAVELLTQEKRSEILLQTEDLNEDGMRVIAVAYKMDPTSVGQLSAADENNMVLMGYLAFLDPPKETTAAAIRALKEYGVDVKILTGDSEKVTLCVCRQVGLQVDQLLLGPQIEAMEDAELSQTAEAATVFARLSPAQKARVVRIFRENGHTVGYMGDGINDAAAMLSSDVGISVDTAVDIAKESANVILLEKNLMVLENGILEGRKTYANMIKYIKMTASSNFGNMFSVLAASAFLPFLPMESIHLILLNLIYDISCTAIPWDNVDKEFLLRPRGWDASSVSKFMLWFGPVSSVFDITTYLLMYFVLCPAVTGGLLFHQVMSQDMQTLYIATFQAGWFIESMWSQTLVIHMIRTPKIPFIQSHAAAPVALLTFTGIAVLTAIPFTPLGAALGLARLPMIYFAWLAATVVCYMLLATTVKMFYIRKFGELL